MLILWWNTHYGLVSMLQHQFFLKKSYNATNRKNGCFLTQYIFHPLKNRIMQLMFFRAVTSETKKTKWHIYENECVQIGHIFLSNTSSFCINIFMLILLYKKWNMCYDVFILHFGYISPCKLCFIFASLWNLHKITFQAKDFFK